MTCKKMRLTFLLAVQTLYLSSSQGGNSMFILIRVTRSIQNISNHYKSGHSNFLFIASLLRFHFSNNKKLIETLEKSFSPSNKDKQEQHKIIIISCYKTNSLKVKSQVTFHLFGEHISSGLGYSGAKTQTVQRFDP